MYITIFRDCGNKKVEIRLLPLFAISWQQEEQQVLMAIHGLKAAGSDRLLTGVWDLRTREQGLFSVPLATPSGKSEVAQNSIFEMHRGCRKYPSHL